MEVRMVYKITGVIMLCAGVLSIYGGIADQETIALIMGTVSAFAGISYVIKK